jgi:hypothetical protein
MPAGGTRFLPKYALGGILVFTRRLRERTAAATAAGTAFHIIIIIIITFHNTF